MVSRVKQELVKLGMESCNFEPALSVWRKFGLSGMIGIHVDYFFFCASVNFEQEVIDFLVFSRLAVPWFVPSCLRD